MNHILLEVFCTKDFPDNFSRPCPQFCNQQGQEGKEPCYNCLFNQCPFCGFTSHENAFCYINERSEAEEIISLGGDMLPDGLEETRAVEHWKKNALRKINEAYSEYMATIDKIK